MVVHGPQLTKSEHDVRTIEGLRDCLAKAADGDNVKKALLSYYYGTVCSNRALLLCGIAAITTVRLVKPCHVIMWHSCDMASYVTEGFALVLCVAVYQRSYVAVVIAFRYRFFKRAYRKCYRAGRHALMEGSPSAAVLFFNLFLCLSVGTRPMASATAV